MEKFCKEYLAMQNSKEKYYLHLEIIINKGNYASNSLVKNSPAKSKKKYIICARKLSLNKGNYALKSFVKNI